MGSEIRQIKNKKLFIWDETLKIEDYILATYYIETSLDPEFSAIAIAMEQSATTTKISGVKDFNLSPFTARVVSIEILGETEEIILPPYKLNTSIYKGEYKEKGYHSCRVKIAFPIANFQKSLINLWNAVGGEVHRIGFLNTVKIMDIEMSERYLDEFKGPLYGIHGIRKKFGIKNRPIFVRSTRPAVGLTTEEMVEIARKVLKCGFDGVKDDELTVDNSISPFEERIKKMVEMVRKVEDETGEKKFYIANIIDEPLKTLRLAELAVKEGVDVLLVSPVLQGLGIVRYISEMTGLPVMSHNSWNDFLTRHPRCGVSEELWIKIQRIGGADMIFLPGNFATDMAEREVEKGCISACCSELGNILPSLPVLAGGKTPQGLKSYVERVGFPEFLLIVATAVDGCPDGIEEGAKRFREAWDMTLKEFSTGESLK